MAVFRFDSGPHLRQRPDNASHRPTPDTFVPSQYRIAILPGQDAGDQPHCRPAIAAVEIANGLAKAAFPDTVNGDPRPLVLYFSAECVEAIERRGAIHAC